ncbi:MAG: hypothetical protein DSO01_04350 [Archaeoglobi archaeon]|nr:MAG: hypothetical protein DSO01_04350 [Archaeoglobi archaeon]TDA27761.1 MAG: hypothetical protein DSN99_03795 [Archaeoglobi archaeon]
MLKRSREVYLQKEVQICVVGKNSGPNKSKVLALNKINEYFKRKASLNVGNLVFKVGVTHLIFWLQ